MKKYIAKHKKLFFIIFALIMSGIISTSAITSLNRIRLKEINKLTTCSQPTGNVVCRGIDVSSYQEDVDFSKVKSAGYDFVILRAGTGLGKDKNFDLYYKQAIEAGLDVGCYFYSYATNLEEVQKEAKDTLKYIKNKTFTYPVFYDFEYPELLSYDRIDLNTRMINTFCRTIKVAGYYPGVYLSSSVYRDFVNTQTINEKWDVWVAEYDDYSGTDKKGYSHKFSMWQYSDRGSVDGISTDVDMNLCFVDYPAVTKEFADKYDKIR